MTKEGYKREEQTQNQIGPNLNLLIKAAREELQNIKPVIDEIKLKKAKQQLDNSLFTWFNLGQRKGKSREIEPCIASSRLYLGLGTLKVPIEHQIRIINELSQAAEGIYRRATHNHFVPESTMQLAAKMWIYSTLPLAAVDKFRGKLK